jgi:hypothetical protein
LSNGYQLRLFDGRDGRDTTGWFAVGHLDDQTAGSAPDEAAVVRALKQTALTLVLTGAKTRDGVIADWLSGHVSDDRAELENLVDEAYESLADPDRFGELIGPEGGGQFALQREAAITATCRFHQELISMLGREGEAGEKLEEACSLIQGRLGASRGLAERIARQSAALGVYAKLDELGIKLPPEDEGRPRTSLLDRLRSLFGRRSDRRIPPLVPRAIDHALSVMAEDGSLMPFVLLEGHPSISVAMLGAAENEEALGLAKGLLEREHGRFKGFVFAAKQRGQVGGAGADLILALYGTPDAPQVRRFAQPYLPPRKGRPSRKVGRLIDSGAAPSFVARS